MGFDPITCTVLWSSNSSLPTESNRHRYRYQSNHIVPLLQYECTLSNDPINQNQSHINEVDEPQAYYDVVYETTEGVDDEFEKEEDILNNSDIQSQLSMTNSNELSMTNSNDVTPELINSAITTDFDLPAGKFFSNSQIIKKMKASSENYLAQIPKGMKRDVGFVVDNSENVDLMARGKPRQYM